MDPLSSAFDLAWSRFQTLSSLRLVPETLESAWTRGHDRYAAFLIPVDDPDVVTHIRPVVERIAPVLGVELYPEPYWHVTIKGLGFLRDQPAQPEELSKRDLERIAAAADDVFSSETAFQSQVGRVNAFPEVVFLEVWAGLPVRELNCRLLETLPDLHRYPFDGLLFLPHISIARFTSDDGLESLKATLSELRGADPGPAFEVDRIDLIEAHLSSEAPALETIASYNLHPPPN